MIQKILGMMWRFIGVIILVFIGYAFYITKTAVDLGGGLGGAIGLATGLIALASWLLITGIVLLVRWIF